MFKQADCTHHGRNRSKGCGHLPMGQAYGMVEQNAGLVPHTHQSGIHVVDNGGAVGGFRIQPDSGNGGGALQVAACAGQFKVEGIQAGKAGKNTLACLVGGQVTVPFQNTAQPVVVAADQAEPACSPCPSNWSSRSCPMVMPTLNRLREAEGGSSSTSDIKIMIAANRYSTLRSIKADGS